MNYYEILAVSSKATPAEIKNACRRMVKLYHPDRNRSREANEQIQLVNEAYATLGDAEKRRAYDLGFSLKPVFHEPPSPQEIYRREFKERKIREAWEAFVRKTWMQRKIHRIMQKMTFCFMGVAFVVILDFYLPVQETIEVGKETPDFIAWRNTGRHAPEYIRTENFVVFIPFNSGIKYEDRGGKNISIEYTPIFHTVRYFGIQQSNSDDTTMYVAQGTVYEPFLWPFLVCISGVIVLLRRNYTERNFHLSFVPVMPAAFMLLALWPK